MRVGTFSIAALVGAMVASCSFWSDHGRDFKTDPSKVYAPTTLQNIAANPGEYENADVEFLALFNRAGEELFAEFYAPFSDQLHLSFSVWPPDARIYQLAGRKRLVPTLFIPKSNPAVSKVTQMQRYTMVKIRGTVRSSFNNMPWIEVYHIQPAGNGELPTHLPLKQPVYTEESLRALIQGLDASAAGQHGTALKKLDEAIKIGLGPEGQFDAHLNMGNIYEKDRNWHKAAWHYYHALQVNPRDQGLREAYLRCRRLAEASGKAVEIEHHDKPEQPQPQQQNPQQSTEREKQLAAEVDRLNAELKAAKDACAGHGKELEEARAKIADLENQLKAKSHSEAEQLKELQKQMDAMKAELEAEKKRAKDAEDRRAASDKDAADAKTRLAEANQKLTEAEVARQNAENKANEATAALTRVQNELEVAREELKKYASGAGPDADAFAKMKHQLAQAEAKLKTVEEENARLKSEKVEEVEKRLRAEYDEQLGKLNRTIKSLRKELDELYKEKKAGIEK